MLGCKAAASSSDTVHATGCFVLYCHYCKSCLKMVIFEMWVGTVKRGGANI